MKFINTDRLAFIRPGSEWLCDQMGRSVRIDFVSATVG